MPNNLVELYKLNTMLNPDVYPKTICFEKSFIKPAKKLLEIF